MQVELEQEETKVNAPRLLDSRVERNQIIEPIDVAMAGPSDATEKDGTENRIVKRPHVVARNGNEHPSPTVLDRPEQRSRLSFFNSSAE